MAFDAINLTDAIFQDYDELTVLLGAADGLPPEPGSPGDPEGDPPVDEVFADTFTGVRCVRVVQSAGGSRLDYAELIYGVEDSLENRSQPASFSRVVEVRLPGIAPRPLLHRGDYVNETAKVEQENESLTAKSQLRPYHFGIPLASYDVWNPLTSADDEVQADIVFNPVVDDETTFNRSDKVRTGGTGYLWTHPELASTATGEAYQEQTRNEWTLGNATQALCETLNGTEQFILNPVGYATLVGAPDVRGVTIALGTRLDKALDMLLIPLGFNWYVDYEAADPVIAFFKIGVGTAKELLFQASGSSLDLALSNVNQFMTDNAIGDSFNQVTIQGQFEEAECTFNLFPAWSASYDGLSPDDIAKDGPEYPGRETVWRLWIASEAGDLDPAVSRLGQFPVVPDLTDVFTHYIPHRRTLMEPLTYLDGTPDTTKARRPHVVHYSIDSGGTWKPAEETWTIKLCPNQIGILFDGKTIPQELYDAGSSARVRITGTIYGDSRVHSTALKQAWAANGRVFEQIITRPDKFQNRFRNTIGDYASVLTGPADEVDHNAECLTFAEAIRDQNHYAEVECEFRLPGLHIEYKIGDLITKIAGREINLDAAPVGAPTNRYVQVVERRYEYDENGPSTVLIVDRGLAELQT